jgi:hypothetical protein
MVNEGDTLKCFASLMNGGGWLQSERGRVPINWGVDPLLIRDTPGLMSYYYQHLHRPDDYFFSAPSGWGYLAPINLPTTRCGPTARMVAGRRPPGDTRYIDVWWMKEPAQAGPVLPAAGRPWACAG